MDVRKLRPILTTKVQKKQTVAVYLQITKSATNYIQITLLFLLVNFPHTNCYCCIDMLDFHRCNGDYRGDPHHRGNRSVTPRFTPSLE